MTDNTQDTKEQCPPALRLTVIPFAGFYESIFSDLIESDLNRVLECPDNLNKEECDELANLVYDVQDFSALRDDTAKAYSESFSEWFKDETGFDLGLQFESMKAPANTILQRIESFALSRPILSTRFIVQQIERFLPI